MEVLELGVIKCVRVDGFLSTAYLGAVFDPWSLCGSRAREPDPSALQALGEGREEKDCSPVSVCREWLRKGVCLTRRTGSRLLAAG